MPHPSLSKAEEDIPAADDVDQGQILSKEEGGGIRSFLHNRLWRHVCGMRIIEAALTVVIYSATTGSFMSILNRLSWSEL